MSQLPSRSTTLIVSRSNKPAHSHENGLLRFWFLLAPTYFSVYPAGLRHTGTCPVSIRQVPTFYSDISWILAHALHRPPARAALASVLLLYHQNRRLPHSTIPPHRCKCHLFSDWHTPILYTLPKRISLNPNKFLGRSSLLASLPLQEILMQKALNYIISCSWTGFLSPSPPQTICLTSVAECAGEKGCGGPKN